MRHRWHASGVLLSLQLLLAAGPSPAQSGTTTPSGPLLTFVGTAAEGPGSDAERTWLVDAAADGPAERIGPGRIGVCDALDDEWLVCRTGWPETHYVLLTRRSPTGAGEAGDDATGERARRTLVAGSYCATVPEFLDVQHRRLYLLSPSWQDRRGSLRVFELRGPEAGRELLDRVHAVIARSLEGLFVLRAGDDDQADRELWFVPRQPGGARRVLDVTLHTGAHGLRGDAAFSPDGRHLAIGHHPLDGTGGALWIVDTVAGALVTHLSGIRLDVAMESSQLPSVLLAWQDDATLRYSRTGTDGFEWVTWSVTGREELGAERYGPVALRHERPPGTADVSAADDPSRLRFDEAGIWFGPGAAGQEVASPEPVVARPAAGWWTGGNKLCRSADGRHAAWYTGGELRLIDGVRRQVRTVYRGTVEFPEWLPAAR